MFALQHKKRTIIITVDDRVRSLKLTYGINSIERADINELSTMINKDLPQVFFAKFR